MSAATREERWAERNRRDIEQIKSEEAALSKLYRMEFFVSACDSCGGHRQSRYVPVEKCVHGNYVTHIDEDIEIVNECELSLTWCPGAGLEDTE